MDTTFTPGEFKKELEDLFAKLSHYSDLREYLNNQHKVEMSTRSRIKLNAAGFAMSGINDAITSLLHLCRYVEGIDEGMLEDYKKRQASINEKWETAEL